MPTFFILFYKAAGFFLLIFFTWILYLSGENFRFLLFCVILVSGVCLSMYTQFSLIGCAGSVGISLAGRVMYIFRACISPLWDWRAGTILFGHSCGVDGGTVQIFFLLWLYSGGYCTGEMVRGGDPIFLLFLQFVVSSSGGWILVGILCYIFCWKICSFISRFLTLLVADC